MIQWAPMAPDRRSQAGPGGPARRLPRLAHLLLSLLLAAPLVAQKSLPELVRDAGSQSFRDREAAARGIGDLGDKGRDALLLLEKLLYDKAPPVRQAAAGALARISGPNATRALLTGLANDDRGVRRDLALGLAEAPDKSLRLLKQALLDEDQEVREHAIVALAAGKSPGILPLLTEAAQTDSDGFVKEKALEGIRGYYEGRPGEADGVTPAMRDAVLAGLQDRSDRVRVQAIVTLAVLTPYGAVTHLEPLTSDRSAEVRQAVFQVLGTLGGSRALTVLAEALKNRQVAVRRDAVHALAQLGKPGVSGLIKALEDESEEIRAEALKALPSPAPPEAVPSLVRLTRDSQSSIRVLALEALTPLGASPQAREAAEGALRDPDPTVRRAAVRAVGQLFGTDVVRVLEPVATDEDLVTFRAKLEALAQAGTSKASTVLAGLLSAGQDGIFRELVLELIMRNRKFAAGALVEVLRKTADPALQQRIVEILGSLGDNRVAEELQVILESEEATDSLRIEAARSLASLEVGAALGAMEDLFASNKHLDRKQEARLLDAIAQLGGSPLALLMLRRYALVAGSLVLLAALLLVWHWVLRPRMDSRAVEAQEERLRELEERAKEPPRIPTEDEFLEQLNEKLQGEPARNRKVRYLTQRGLVRYIKMAYDAASTDLEQVARLFTDDDDADTKARVYFFLGKAAVARGDKQTAQRRLSDALGFHDKRVQSDVMREIAEDPGNLDRSLEILEKSLPFDDDINVVDVQKLKVL